MNGVAIFLAASGDTFAQRVKDVTEGTKLPSGEILLALVIGLMVGAGLFIWAYLRHRKKADKEESRDLNRFKPGSGGSGSAARGSEGRRRRRRRPHRPRNPSLQQTGGLPTPRPDNEPPKY